MGKNKLATIITVFLILALVSGIIYFKNFQGLAIQDMPSEKVAKWIGEHSVLYVQTGCSHCVDQENLFGENVKYLTIVNYFDEGGKQKFTDAEIEKTPTWVIDGEKYVGVQSIEKLKELTGYQN